MTTEKKKPQHAQHTPEWLIEGNFVWALHDYGRGPENRLSFAVQPGAGVPVEEGRATAAELVRRWNAHEALVYLATEVADCSDGAADSFERLCVLRDLARAALAKARPK